MFLKAVSRSEMYPGPNLFGRYFFALCLFAECPNIRPSRGFHFHSDHVRKYGPRFPFEGKDIFLDNDL